jgi:hypothetical protein
MIEKGACPALDKEAYIGSSVSLTWKIDRVK